MRGDYCKQKLRRAFGHCPRFFCIYCIMLIGVTDSGIGGLTTLEKIIRSRGGGDYLYLADGAHCPYGEKSAEQIREIMRENVSLLEAAGAKCVVLACNTATACAIDALRAEFAKITFIGTEPCIKTAEIYGKRLLLLATPLTLGQPRFSRLLADTDCALPDCSRLAGEIERGFPSMTEAKKLLLKILAPFRNERFDAAVLGCTHYVLLKDYIFKLLRCPVLDGSGGVARQARKLCGAETGEARVNVICNREDTFRTVRAAADYLIGKNPLFSAKLDYSL